MEQVNVWKCNFCNKTAFHKGTIRNHEKICFYNPLTKSCASCLWFSGLHLSEYPVHCFKNEFTIDPQNPTAKSKLKTQCKKWIDVAVIEEIDIWDEQNREVFNLLLEGKEELLPFIEELQGK